MLTVAAHRAAGTSVTWRPGTAPLSPAVRNHRSRFLEANIYQHIRQMLLATVWP